MSKDVELEQFHALAVEAKKFLDDHEVPQATDTMAGHMAIWAQRHIAKAVAEARLEELKLLDDDSCLAPDCPDDCYRGDPHHPRERHWHHVTHRTIEQRAAQLTSHYNQKEVR